MVLNRWRQICCALIVLAILASTCHLHDATSLDHSTHCQICHQLIYAPPSPVSTILVRLQHWLNTPFLLIIPIFALTLAPRARAPPSLPPNCHISHLS